MKTLDIFIQRWRQGKVGPYVRPGCRVLDIGSSDGSLWRRFPAMGTYVGVDPAIKVPQQLGPGARLVPGYFPEAVEGEAPFDVIALLAVMEHLPPAVQAVLARHASDFLVPGGHLVLTVPSPRVDHVLTMLRWLHLVEAETLHQHYGFDPRQTQGIMEKNPLLRLSVRKGFQLGLNNLFVFKRLPPAEASA